MAVTTHGRRLAYVFNDNYPKLVYLKSVIVDYTHTMLNLILSTDKYLMTQVCVIAFAIKKIAVREG